MADTLTDAENRYSGIPTIRREMAAYSLPEPLFENRRGEFVVTLRHSMEPAEPSCDGAQTDLLSYCTVPRTRQEIAAFLGIKTASYAIRQYVLPLVETGKLKMTIPDRPGSPRQTYFTRPEFSGKAKLQPSSHIGPAGCLLERGVFIMPLRQR